MNKRTYLFMASREGAGFEFWPDKIFMTSVRIRQACLVLFKKYYGDWPKKHWHQDGFMAEAWDNRGRRVTLEQINDNDLRLASNNPSNTPIAPPRSKWMNGFLPPDQTTVQP